MNTYAASAHSALHFYFHRLSIAPFLRLSVCLFAGDALQLFS
jgi:hypothetical protein